VIADFCSCGTPDIELTIQLDTSSHRTHLLELARHGSLGKNVSALYVYSLVDSHVTYPDQEGRVVYIGQAMRATGNETTGRRFSQHISKGPTTGSDTGTNYVLSRYYWLGKALKVKVYVVHGRFSQTARELEMKLINQHMRQFGAPPIGQGAACARTTYEARCHLPLVDLLAEVGGAPR
jgi:hypothetical protein